VGMKMPKTKAPRSGVSAMSTYLSAGAAISVPLTCAYGYATSEAGVVNKFAILAGLMFTGLYFLAVRRKAWEDQPKGQVFVVLSMILSSLTVHILYLPAGIFCFIALMICQNDLIYKPKKKRI